MSNRRKLANCEFLQLHHRSSGNKPNCRIPTQLSWNPAFCNCGSQVTNLAEILMVFGVTEKSTNSRIVQELDQASVLVIKSRIVVCPVNGVFFTWGGMNLVSLGAWLRMLAFWYSIMAASNTRNSCIATNHLSLVIAARWRRYCASTSANLSIFSSKVSA